MRKLFVFLRSRRTHRRVFQTMTKIIDDDDGNVEFFSSVFFFFLFLVLFHTISRRQPAATISCTETRVEERYVIITHWPCVERFFFLLRICVRTSYDKQVQRIYRAVVLASIHLYVYTQVEQSSQRHRCIILDVTLINANFYDTSVAFGERTLHVWRVPIAMCLYMNDYYLSQQCA